MNAERHPRAPRVVQLDAGPIGYDEVGPPSGRAIVFIHGYLIGPQIWQPVSQHLARQGFRCLAPQWPLGTQTSPMRHDAALTMEGVAAMVDAFCQRLHLRDVVLVGVDTGGAISQLVATEHPAHLGALVLLSCDAFEHFPPPVLDGLIEAAQLEDEAMFRRALVPMRADTGRAVFAKLSHRNIDDLIAQWTRPATTDPLIAADLRRLTASLNRASTVHAGQRLPSFTKPALVAWSADDAFFPVEDGRRLADALPNGRFELIHDARTLSMIDRPAIVAGLIGSIAAG